MQDSVSQVKKLSGFGTRLALGGLAFALMLGCMGLTATVLQGYPLAALPGSIASSATFLMAGFGVSVLTLLRMSRISVWNMTAQALPVWSTLTVVSIILMLVLRLPYSTIFFGINWFAGLALLLGFAQLVTRQSVLNVGLLEGVALPDSLVSHHEVRLAPGEPAPPDLDAVVARQEQMEDPRFTPMLTELAINKTPVIPEHVFTEQITGRVDLGRTDASELMQLVPWRRYSLLKRTGDIVLALACIVLFSPVMLLLALLIRMESSGNPIFIQRRVGAGGREFQMLKFRSMVESAEGEGAKFASRNDRRITKLGGFMRKWRLDELPQFFNVLVGSMSVIGPRPEQRALVDELAGAIPLYRFRHVIRPGITGWAQVMQGYADDVESTDVKLSYDLFYIKNLSLTMDLVVFFKTLKTVFTGFGSR